MSELMFGSRLDALVEWQKRDKVEIFTFDLNKSPEELAHEFAMTWSGDSLPRRNIVFVCPPSHITPAGLKPKKSRHVIFEDRLPTPWATWSKKHEGKVTTTEMSADPDVLAGALVKGVHGLPRCTPEAARHIVACCPGGRQALWWPAQQIKAMELPEPISLEDAMEAWPFVVHKGKTYAVSLTQLLRLLGTESAISLVSKAPEKETYGALMGLKTACNSQTDRLQWLNSLLKGVEEKRWTPKAALVLFTHLCLIEKKGHRWPSKKKVNTLSSPALTTLYRLFDIPC